MDTKEDLILEKAKDFMCELHSADTETIKEEFMKLLTNYEKLNNVFKSVLKMSDNTQKHIFERNDSLNDNINTVKRISREQVMSHVAKNSKLKQSHSHDMIRQQENIKQIQQSHNWEMLSLDSNYKKQIKDLEKEIEELKSHNQQLLVQIKKIK